MTDCPSCGLTAQANDFNCRSCGAKIRGASKVPWIIAAVILGLVVLGSMLPKPPIDTSRAPGGATSNASGHATGWSYDSYHDAVRNGTVRTAETRSLNTEQLHFPYGETFLTLSVRQHPQYGLQVIFEANDGQIICSPFDCRATINIDGRTQRLSMASSADGDPKVVFARNAAGLIAQLRHSSHVIVELTFFQDGNRQFEFNTANLQWPPR